MKEATLVSLLAIYGVAWYREINNISTKESPINLLIAQAGTAFILLTVADFSPQIAFALALLVLTATIMGVGIQSGKGTVKSNG